MFPFCMMVHIFFFFLSGWSEWRTDPKYKCKCTNDKKHHVLKVRKCNNPEPLFKDVGCLGKYKYKGSCMS